ncbi:hypothetical protein OJAV_G00039040 [Oryzias javanicus]|uniref:Uncharacterized protein n=1 Tax=Oryzias javanicus TaxID=123683 RepID=A0A3S2PXC9_ORYJA|nr:hypothetical protein OJAV_G00039040 [Oryzias javanicus]
MSNGERVRAAVLTARNRVLTVVPDRLPPPAALCDRETGTSGAPAKAAAAAPLRKDSSSNPGAGLELQRPDKRTDPGRRRDGTAGAHRDAGSRQEETERCSATPPRRRTRTQTP